jgi:hypothetical protein
MSCYVEIPSIIYNKIPRGGDIHIIKSSLDIGKLHEVIIVILREYCEVSVIGFNNTENFYWCKMDSNKKCVLYSEIRLIANDVDSSIIIIINESDFHLKLRGIMQNNKTTKTNFLTSVKEGLWLYQNSTFARCFTDTE